MSVHFWGDNPKGTWNLEVFNDASVPWGFEAKFYTWSLQLFGTESDPSPNMKSDETNFGNSKLGSSEKADNSLPVSFN